MAEMNLGHAPGVQHESCDFGRVHRPESKAAGKIGGLPGLVLIHDVWGLSEHSVALAQDWAREGFAVLEIDLYRTHGEFSIEDPGVHIRSLNDPAILADLAAAAEWLADQDVCRGRKIGVTGVCMGGTFTALAACHSNLFSAAAPFYGILSYTEGMLADPVARDLDRKPISPLEAASGLRMPMLASFGREDQMIPNSDVAAYETALAASGMAFEIDQYEGAGHAYLNHTRPGAYHEASAITSWNRAASFLRAELGEARD